MYRFDRVAVCLDSREVFVDGTAQHLSTRAFDILELLIRADGNVVTKDEMMRVVWPHTIVGDNNIQVHVSALRKLLGGKQGWIKTCAGRGYRLARPPATQAACAEPHAVREQPVAPWPAAPALAGRDRALDEVRAMLAEAPVLTLTGPGGVGKTALAREAAQHLGSHLRARPCFVDLASQCPAATVAQATASALGLGCNARPADIDHLFAEIGERAVVLILDGGEHVVDELAAFCRAIRVRHAHNPRIRVVTTTREPLYIEGERIYRLPALDLPETDASDADILASGAVQMFLGTGEAMGSRFPRDSATLHAVAALCRRLDGIPLALELAASRASSIGIRAVLCDADEQMLALPNRLRYAAARQSTLEASIDWSYRLLDEAERTVLCRLARHFRGWFAPEAACGLAACTQLDTDAVREAIARLVSKSMIVTRQRATGSMCSLPGMVRAFALKVAGKEQAPGAFELAPSRVPRASYPVSAGRVLHAHASPAAV